MLKVSRNLLLLILSWPHFLWAGLVTFGAEFSFTNPDIYRNSSSGIVNEENAVEYQHRFKEEVRRRCGDCRIRSIYNSYGVEVFKVTYPDGWYFVISTDPAVVEVQTKASTVEEISARKTLISRDIFDAAKAVGIVPNNRYGGGHIHIGFKSAIGKDLLTMRNFMVDFVNHSKLWSGFFANDVYNAPTILDLSKQNQIAFRKIIRDVDSGKIRTIEALVDLMHAKVYNKHSLGWGPPQKYQALNLRRVVDAEFPLSQRTLEIRSLEAQRSVEEYLTLIKLFQGRISYLQNQREPLVLEDFDKLNGESKKEQIERLFRYVSDSGLHLKLVKEHLFRSDLLLADEFLRQIKSFGSAPVGLCRQAYLK